MSAPISATARVTISPCTPTGKINAPPSKSISHRMLICAALADGQSELSGLSFSEDILATMDVLGALGARFEVVTPDGARDGEVVRVYGCGGRPDGAGKVLFCRESGSTLRFVIPLCLRSAQGCVLQGSARLLSRPLRAYEELFPTRMGERTVDVNKLCDQPKLQLPHRHGGNNSYLTAVFQEILYTEHLV